MGTSKGQKMKNKPNIETSTLLRRISEAIKELNPKDGRLHVSVSKDVKWEKSLPNNDEVLVRWLCWSIEDGNKEILPPEFEVLSPDVTKELLSKEIPICFPNIDVIVDDDIDV